ncbi:MAG: helix-turn-helix transcriptional regulator [Paracoccaceae bacterium]
MSKDFSTDNDTRRSRQETRATIVDRLYDVALDPIRLGDLLEIWESGRQDNGLAADAGLGIDAPDLDAHMQRASVFLDRFEATRDDGGYRALLEDIPRSAAFVCDGGAAIAAFNRAAALAFGLSEGAQMAALPFEPEDIATLRDVVRQVAGGRRRPAGRTETVVTLRIRSCTTGSPVIVRVSPVDSAAEPPLALVLSSELVWPDGFEATVMEAFGLTAAEAAIVQGITLGQPVRDIAQARGRSPETVRTQLRSILAKTETHSQPELVRVVLGLLDVATIPAGRSGAVGGASALQSLGIRHLDMAGGRTIDWLEFGDPGGSACLYMHLDYGLVRWPASAEAEARRRGIRVIVPVRPGYGHTSPLPARTEHVLGCARDCAAVLDHLQHFERRCWRSGRICALRCSWRSCDRT